MTEKMIRSMAGYVLVECSLSSLKADNKRVIEKGEIDGFFINPHNKWDGKPEDLHRITDQVKALNIPVADDIGLTVTHLSRFKLLEYLYVAECSLPIKFESPCLRELGIGLTKRMTLGSLPNLEYLYLRNVNNPNTPPSWPEMPKLRYLALVLGGLQTLEGIDRLETLAHLDISYLNRLESIAALRELPIKHLWIEACSKISNLPEVVSALRGLNSLRIINCGVLKNLSFLSNLSLQEFRFLGTKVLDGNLSLLDKIPVVSFDDARHYNRKKKNFDGHNPSPSYQK